MTHLPDEIIYKIIDKSGITNKWHFLLLLFNLRLTFKVNIKKFMNNYKDEWNNFYKPWIIKNDYTSNISNYTFYGHFIGFYKIYQIFKNNYLFRQPYVDFLSNKKGTKYTQNVYKYIYNNISPNDLFMAYTNDTLYWKCILIGPPDTLYSKGMFLVDIKYNSDSPYKAPYVRFINQIYHPNININGVINIDLLSNWAVGINRIDKLLLSILSFLSDPDIFCNQDDTFDPEITDLYKTNKTKFNQNVKDWTRNYASICPYELEDWILS